jgi:hypothetical protein
MKRIIKWIIERIRLEYRIRKTHKGLISIDVPVVRKGKMLHFNLEDLAKALWLKKEGD